MSHKKTFEDKRKAMAGYRDLREATEADEKFGERIFELVDENSFEELFADMSTSDPINFPDYDEKLDKYRAQTKVRDALICGIGRVEGEKVMCLQLSNKFMMGSMGTVVGEKFTMAVEEADALSLPLVVYSSSGGARMQEGMFSLLQMAKTSAAVERFKNHGGLYISVLTHPTTGGVSASFATLGDIILAEPGALIGFAGPRVIEQTIGQKLPKGFQRAEFQLEHGLVDKVVERDMMPDTIRALLKLHREVGVTREVRDLTQEAVQIRKSAWERISAARDKDRPRNIAFIDNIFEGFIELCGDHICKDDKAIIGGIAYLNGRPVTVIAHRKGRSAEENIKYNFGMPGPEGYRKAMRLMKEAEKFNRPIITFIDTPGAYPGLEAEENGQSIAIASNLAEMSALKVPVLAIVTGEGSSGGALAIGVVNSMWMLENAVYSVLSPEGFSSILWKDTSRVQEASEVMRMTADDLYDDGIADRVIREPLSGLENDFENFCAKLKDDMTVEIDRLSAFNAEEIADLRYKKYRHFEGAKAAFIPEFDKSI